MTDIQNLVDYIRDMGIIETQCETARPIAASIYQHNPLSRGVPCFGELDGHFLSIETECRNARKLAERFLLQLISDQIKATP
jgi:hypothetical protein